MLDTNRLTLMCGRWQQVNVVFCGLGKSSLSWDIKEVDMTDMLIRDVPDDVIAALDAHAGRLGLSRSEYVRRRLAQDAATSSSPVSVTDLARFAEVFGDLADPDVMSRAWQ
jgi:plasmid stability protein